MGRPLDGYPDSFGSHRASVFPHTGPVSYAVLTTGPVAGGNVVEASEAGLKYIDWLDARYTDSGTYIVQPFITAGHASSSVNGGATTTFRLKWVVLSTGVEVVAGTDLSAEVVRCLAIGPK